MSEQLELPNDEFNLATSEDATPALGTPAVENAEEGIDTTPPEEESAVPDNSDGQGAEPDEGAKEDSEENVDENSDENSVESVKSSRRSKGKKKRRRRPRLSEEERAVLWHKAIIRKAKKLKGVTDILLMLTLIIIIATHFIPKTPLIGVVEGANVEGVTESSVAATGFDVYKRLLTEHKVTCLLTQRHEETNEVITLESGDQLVPDRRLALSHDAHPVSYGILGIGIGAAFILLLYLLDYVLWMGRLLPLLSMLWGGSGVLYLIYTRVLTDGKWPGTGVWNALGYGEGAKIAWYLILISLFMHAVFALLRFVVSQRWKRYEYAGLPVPDKCKPKNYPELTDDREKKEDNSENTEDISEDANESSPDDEDSPEQDNEEEIDD